MKALTGEQGLQMMNLIMAKTYLEECKREISKMKAAEYMFSELHGQVKHFGPYQSVLNAKSKGAALSDISGSLYSIENEIKILEKNYEPVEIDAPKSKKNISGDDLLALFIGG